MPVLDYVSQDYISTFAPHTPLREILIYMGQVGENIDIDNGSFMAAHSLYTYRSQVKVVAGKSLPTFNHLVVSKRTSHNNQINQPIDCIYVVDKLQLLGIVTLADVIRLLNSGMNLAAVKLAEVMREPVITLEEDFDVNKTLALIQQYGISHLPIVNSQGELLGIVTPESLALGLQKELAKIKESLQLEIAQRCSLEISLKKAEEESERRINQATTELIAANQELQRGICDRIATEAQLLQTTKDTNSRLLQEISERQRIEEVLRYRVEFEKLITAISTHFINLAPDKIEDGINQALQLIGEVTNVDCAYVFVFDEDNNIDNTYKWYAEDIESQVDNLQDIRDVVLSWRREKLSNFETLHIPNVHDWLVTVSTTKADLTTQNLRSLIIVPIICSGLLIGYLEFGSVKATKTWTADSITMLKMVGEILGNALERKRIEQALRISEERYIRAISAAKVGIWEWNINTNEIYIDPNLQAMLGYTEQETPKYYDDWLKFVHPDDVEYVKNGLNQYLAGITTKYEIEHRMLNKNGSCIWFLSRGTLLCDVQSNECFIAGSNTDITARTQAENKLKISLKEKEILLKEIHHRVKNNLQIISSLLRLQSRYVNDGETLEIFQDSHNRVRAMAIIHENLYHSHDLTQIEFCDYVRSLTNNLLRSYGVKSKHKIHLKINNISLKIDTAISCGLIINELVTNSIKHAFANGQQGDIYVKLVEIAKNQYSLIVSDNGVGLSKDIEIYKNQSLGLKLVWSLVEQLEGMITFSTSLGTSFTITFSEQN